MHQRKQTLIIQSNTGHDRTERKTNVFAYSVAELLCTCIQHSIKHCNVNAKHIQCIRSMRGAVGVRRKTMPTLLITFKGTMCKKYICTVKRAIWNNWVLFMILYFLFARTFKFLGQAFSMYMLPAQCLSCQKQVSFLTDDWEPMVLAPNHKTTVTANHSAQAPSSPSSP